ncbi:LuxR C-terminal-related transcriptional regulator [Propionicimonas sp.]|uniref:LuxR C-terminal-related transcriptional regulator n=1 Tax=Propionicimonas sp. TaxID=1955623 RepID=UPI0039E2A8FC
MFSSGIASRVLGHFAAGGTSTATVPFPELTEREILDLVARGLTNTKIANRLVLPPKTVRNRAPAIPGVSLERAPRRDVLRMRRPTGTRGRHEIQSLQMSSCRRPLPWPEVPQAQVTNRLRARTCELT